MESICDMKTKLDNMKWLWIHVELIQIIFGVDMEKNLKVYVEANFYPRFPTSSSI